MSTDPEDQFVTRITISPPTSASNSSASPRSTRYGIESSGAQVESSNGNENLGENGYERRGSGRARSGSQNSSVGESSRGGGEGNANGRTQFPLVDRGYRPSIRIRRSSQGVPQTTVRRDFGSPPSSSHQNQNSNATITEGRHVGGGGRTRASSTPLSKGEVGMGGRHLPRLDAMQHMPGLMEEIISPVSGRINDVGEIPVMPVLAEEREEEREEKRNEAWRPLRRAKTNIGAEGKVKGEKEGKRISLAENEDNEYESELVDILDIVDPEVSMLSTLTNVQNSLFVPDLGKYLNRRPTYTLTRAPADEESRSSASSLSGGEESTRPKRPGRMATSRTYTGGTLNTLSSRVNDKYYAVLPHGTRLPGWTEEEKLELNDHVRHMLHSKRSKFKRSMKGFGQYVKKPLGFFVTLYATLITLFGLAWVLFLIGWINVGGRQSYIINIIDNVLVALFAIIGDGLAPFRAVDTYHMIFIAHYHHLTWRLRKEQSLPKLSNKNDLPPLPTEGMDLDSDTHPPSTNKNKDETIPEPELPKEEEEEEGERQEFSVLNESQQKKLAHHQKKFAKSHSFYKPHETSTHHAFPLRLLVATTVLLDCHSLLQIALGTCTWSIPYKTRPFALTTVILCCSITCNITAGVLISIGDHKTRKKDVFERMERQELTASAMRVLEKRRETEVEMEEREKERVVGEGGVWAKPLRISRDDDGEGGDNKAFNVAMGGAR